MDLKAFAKEVHENAVKHGWWGENYNDDIVISLIHAEISEALEEWRNNRPMVWRECRLDTYCSGNCTNVPALCTYRGAKPEGIGIELIDVALRVLDAAAAWGIEIRENDVEGMSKAGVLCDAHTLVFTELIVSLHYATTMLYFDVDRREAWLNSILCAVFTWLKSHAVDPEELLMEKHRYNLTRPFRHGGKRI